MEQKESKKIKKLYEKKLDLKKKSAIKRAEVTLKIRKARAPYGSIKNKDKKCYECKVMPVHKVGLCQRCYEEELYNILNENYTDVKIFFKGFMNEFEKQGIKVTHKQLIQILDGAFHIADNRTARHTLFTE